jgi:hypothetical protein
MKHLSFILLLFFVLPIQKLKSQSCTSIGVAFISEYQTASPNAPQTPLADRLNRPYLYVAAKDGGLLIFNISNINSPTLIYSITINQLDTLHVMNLHQEGNYLYLALGNFFGNVGSAVVQQPGMAIIDITNPSAPIIMDKWKYSVKERGASFITVQGNYAYLSAMHKGLMILDITDKNNIQFVSEYQPDINFPTPSPTAAQMPNARGMAIRGDSVFLCYDAGGLRIINIANKNTPFQVRQYINTATTKQQAYNNIVLNGSLAYIAVDYCGMEILNISNLSSISQTGWWNPYHCESLSNWWINSPGHANQLHYLASFNTVFLSMGGSQLRVLNVANPVTPDSCTGYGISGDGNGTWGLDVYNNTIFLANFIAAIPYTSNWAGIKILSLFPVGINETNNINDVYVFPNPFTDGITITLKNNNRNFTVEIYTTEGKLIKREENISGNTYACNGIDNAGMYVTKIIQADNVIIKKIIKAK